MPTWGDGGTITCCTGAISSTMSWPTKHWSLYLLVSICIGLECCVNGVIERQGHAVLFSQANHRSIERLDFQPAPSKQIKGHRPLCPRFQRFQRSIAPLNDIIRQSDARKRLIEAAKDVIYAQSYEAVSVDDLCAAARVTKSSFYHFFSSKQDLVLVAMESQWQWFEQTVLKPTFADHLPPQERIVRLFDLILQGQQAQKQASGHMRGCPVGNLTLEMSTQDELIRTQVERFFREWLSYFERMLCEAKEQGIVPATLNTTVTAQALLAYFEGVMLLAKSRNDPALIATLRTGTLSLMQYQDALAS